MRTILAWCSGASLGLLVGFFAGEAARDLIQSHRMH